jgi:hypothetical protein
MTKLSPLEEVLFRTWARANGVDNHDDPNNYFDHRGLFKQSNGLIQPIGVVKSITDAHNKGVEASQSEGGDTTMPDPYAAQAEMHGNMLKAQGDAQKQQQQIALEREKMAHTSQEKEKDRQHKLQLEQMKLQQKAQQEQMKAQMQAEQQQQQMAQQAQMAEADRAGQMQMADADRQANAAQSQAERENGMQQSMMKEHFERTRPQQEPSPSPQQPQGDSGLRGQLMSRALGQ